jgi:hypothetical protein
MLFCFLESDKIIRISYRNAEKWNKKKEFLLKRILSTNFALSTGKPHKKRITLNSSHNTQKFTQNGW